MKKHAVMLYIIKDNKILFLVRNKANDTVHEQGKLVSIGGKIEEGEPIRDAVIHEAQEEAGIIIKNPDLKAILYFRNFGIEKNDWIDYIFICHEFEGNITSGNEGSFIWKHITDIPELNIYDMDKVFIPMLIKHNFFVAEFLCDGHNLIEYTLLKAL